MIGNLVCVFFCVSSSMCNGGPRFSHLIVKAKPDLGNNRLMEHPSTHSRSDWIIFWVVIDLQHVFFAFFLSDVKIFLSPTFKLQLVILALSVFKGLGNVEKSAKIELIWKLLGGPLRNFFPR